MAAQCLLAYWSAPPCQMPATQIPGLPLPSRISFPPLATYPVMEDLAWPMLSAALHGTRSVGDALAEAQHQVTTANITMPSPETDQERSRP
jgi:hypothetical protein